MRAGPATAVRSPPQVAATIEDATNAVVGQLISAAPPISPTMLGNIVASRRTFIEYSKTPATSTVSDGSHSGLASAAHGWSAAPSGSRAALACPVSTLSKTSSQALERGH